MTYEFEFNVKHPTFSHTYSSGGVSVRESQLLHYPPVHQKHKGNGQGVEAFVEMVQRSHESQVWKAHFSKKSFASEEKTQSI